MKTLLAFFFEIVDLCCNEERKVNSKSTINYSMLILILYSVEKSIVRLCSHSLLALRSDRWRSLVVCFYESSPAYAGVNICVSLVDDSSIHATLLGIDPRLVAESYEEY